MAEEGFTPPTGRGAQPPKKGGGAKGAAMPKPPRGEEARGVVDAALRARLSRDPTGQILLLSYDLGWGLEPSMSDKMRLQREFGVYAQNWDEPFGPGSKSE